MSWVNIRGGEIGEEKVETFERTDSSGVVIGIVTVTSRRKVKRLEWERVTKVEGFTYEDFASEVDIGTWLGVHCIEHTYDWDPVTFALEEWKLTEGASSWLIVRNDYEELPSENDITP